MRYFLLLLFITFLCTCGRAQLTINAKLALVADQCAGSLLDANDDCSTKANSTNRLVYHLGQDRDLLFTYELINNSGKIIRRVEATDSHFGDFFPAQKINISHGTTVPLHFIYDALTKPETIDGQVTLKVQYADGSTEETSGIYTLKAKVIAAPEITSPSFSAPTNALSVFPNPAADQLTLRGFASGPISVIDMQGKVVLRTTLPSSGTVNVSDFPSGAYLLRAGGECVRWLKR